MLCHFGVLDLSSFSYLLLVQTRLSNIFLLSGRKHAASKWDKYQMPMTQLSQVVVSRWLEGNLDNREVGSAFLKQME